MAEWLRRLTRNQMGSSRVGSNPTRSGTFFNVWQTMKKSTFMKSLRHRVFPGGPPSKYYPGPTMLNFRDQTRTGVFIVVWS